MTTNHVLQDVDSLHFGCEDAEVREYDWSADYGEGWVSYQAPDPDQEDGYDASDEGPMMNYYYPLPSHKSFDVEDAAKLDGLCLCIVNFSDSNYRSDVIDDRPDFALALTGGGMDLSWDIAEAHMRLGLLPPLHVCRLPRYAGKDLTEPHAAWVIAGCRRTCEAMRDRAQSAVDYLDGLVD